MAQRVASLLPSATEIVGALGLQHLLVGVSHECDLAPEAADLEALLASGACRRLTSSDIQPHAMTQAEIHTVIACLIYARRAAALECTTGAVGARGL